MNEMSFHFIVSKLPWIQLFSTLISISFPCSLVWLVAAAKNFLGQEMNKAGIDETDAAELGKILHVARVRRPPFY